MTDLKSIIATHRLLVAAIEAYPGEEDPTQEALIEAETKVLDAIVEAPCASDAELIEKLKYLAPIDFTCGDRARMAVALENYVNRSQL